MYNQNELAERKTKDLVLAAIRISRRGSVKGRYEDQQKRLC